MTDKFEQLLEFVVNDEMDKADALFHEIVVAKSREIYEGLISAEAEEVGGSEVDDLINSITDDESAIHEEGDAEEAPEIDDAEEVPAEPEAHGTEGAGEDDVEDLEARIDDITDALAQLKAQFADMLSAEAGEEGHADELPAELPASDEMPADDEEKTEESVLEYKEAAPKPVLTDSPGNSKSTVASKNNMGGTAGNLNQGSAEEKGRPAPKVGSLTSANTEFKMSKVAAPKNKE